MGLAEDVMARFPSLSWLLNDWEIGPLLIEAVDPNRGFDAATFQARLYQTNWYRGRSQAEREWDIKVHTDPTTATADRNAYLAQLRVVASRFGVQLNEGQLGWLTEMGLRAGTPADSPVILQHLSDMRLRGYAPGGPGGVQTNSRRSQEIARGDYLVMMSPQEAMKWGDWLTRGMKTEEDLRQEMHGRAKTLYPWASTGLSQGSTMSELIDPQRQIIAEELELDPNSINFTNGKWSKLLLMKDKENPTGRLATATETMAMARQDQRYWKTIGGKRQDAELTMGFLDIFGKRKRVGV